MWDMTRSVLLIYPANLTCATPDMPGGRLDSCGHAVPPISAVLAAIAELPSRTVRSACAAPSSPLDTGHRRIRGAGVTEPKRRPGAVSPSHSSRWHCRALRRRTDRRARTAQHRAGTGHLFNEGTASNLALGASGCSGVAAGYSAHDLLIAGRILPILDAPDDRQHESPGTPSTPIPTARSARASRQTTPGKLPRPPIRPPDMRIDRPWQPPWPPGCAARSWWCWRPETSAARSATPTRDS